MNYKIIQDKEAFQHFLRWLPDLSADECFMLCLFARKKYAPVGFAPKGDKNQLKRVTCTKETMLQKIRQIEVQVGAYSIDGQVVPQESLVLYITPNPRSHSKAAKNLLITLAELVTKPYSNYNPQALALTELQKSHSRKPYFDIDLDGVKAGDVRAQLQGKINLNAVSVLTTRGGCHLLVEVAKIKPSFAKTWYNELINLPGVDVRGDNLLPVPGCCQGGFVPVLQEFAYTPDSE